MRTFPQYLRAFQEIVNERGQRLRQLSFDQLKQIATDSSEIVTVESRPATISVIVQPGPNNTLKVVVQGFVKAKLFPGKHVAIDGFYKHQNGTVTAMPEREFYDFD